MKKALAATYIIAGFFLHAALLLVPALVLGRLHEAITQPVVVFFLFAATLFYLSDMAVIRNFRLPTKQDIPSYRRAAATGILILASFWLGLGEYLWRDTPWIPAAHIPGAVILLAGVALRYAAIRKLGSYFITAIRVEPDQTLVTSGVFAWIRHPSETANLLIVLGAAVLFGAVAAAAVWALALVPLVVWRVRVEDRVLHDAFGAQFESHKAHVKRLIPYVY